MFRTPRLSLTMEMMVLAVGVLSYVASATVPNVQVPAPRNLRVSSYNLEHVLQWDSPNTSTSWDGANTMTYSVKQLVFNEDALEDRWEELPHCAHVRVNQCQVTNTTYAVYDTHHFKVFAEIGNRTSFSVESFKFVPY
uniref:Fibronectin type-III domain-containing protein n=1 Tax=Ciona savignyi TaxID=51511 RepID=H2Z2C9_CIOSA